MMLEGEETLFSTNTYFDFLDTLKSIFLFYQGLD